MLDAGEGPAADQVNDALAQSFWRLRFPLRLEAFYEDETRQARRRHLAVVGVLGLLLYDFFIVADLAVIPDVFATAIMVRFGIVTPILLAALALLWFDPPPALRDGTQASLGIIATASIMALMWMSDDPLRIHYFYGSVIIILFTAIVQRIHFRFAASACVGSAALCILTLAQFPEIPVSARLTAAIILLSVLFLTLFASYGIERQSRQGFLLKQRDRLRVAELDAMANTDPLTGLSNRRRLDALLKVIWASADDEPEPVCVLLLDIDCFKTFNDRHGHIAGDRCLRRVAAIAEAEIRAGTDLAVRFGGEELLLLLHGANLEDGLSVAESIRRSIEATAIRHGESSVGPVVTVSVGAASAIPSDLVSPDELISSADTALYVAKRSGRNQVHPTPFNRAEALQKSQVA